MRNARGLVTCGILIGMAACGDSAPRADVTYICGPTNDAGFSGPPGTTCTGVPEYQTCVKDKCGSRAKLCWGNDYQSGNYGGLCGDAMKCSTACLCDASYQSCVGQCHAKYLTSQCQNCFRDLVVCEGQCPFPVCS